MNDPSLQTLLTDLDSFLRLDRLPDLALLVLGVVVGLVAKNLYALVKNLLGFAGSFFGRLFVGWWQDLRREAPNILDVAMVVPVVVSGRRLLMLDGLVGARRLTDLYINPRTAFGVRIQAMFARHDRPWIHFPPPRETRLSALVRRGYNRSRRAVGLAEVTPQMVRRIKYRRVYQPIESLIGQVLTNEWAAAATLGEPVYLFRFIVVVVYEKYSDDYIDRQFHALVVWDYVLDTFTDADDFAAMQPEFRHRAATLQRIARAWRAAGPEQAWEFGSLFVAVPRAQLSGSYVSREVKLATGETVPVHHPAGGRADPSDAAFIVHRAAVMRNA
jgi:uncharacterized membrane protein YeaQ/YmgE (transglycosylase-associated protein family)